MSILANVLKNLRLKRKLPAGEHALSTAARALLDRDNNVVFDAEAISQGEAASLTALRALLGLAIGTNVQAYDADLATWAGLTPSANAQSLVTAANYAAMRTLLGVSASELTINDQVDDYTLVLADAGKYVRMNKGTAVELEVPPNASVAFAIGTQIVIRAVGAGQVTVAAGVGVTITSSQTLLLRAQHSSAVLVKVATNTWELSGDLEAA